MANHQRCQCIDVAPGSFTNQIELKPWWGGAPVGVDRCLAGEIKKLWAARVKTTGSCCGHNRARPMINVAPEYHARMVALGYSFWINRHGATCYEPQSLKKFETLTPLKIMINWIKARLLKHRHRWQIRGVNRYGSPTYRVCLKCREPQKLVSGPGGPELWEKCEPVPFLDLQFNEDDQFIFNN